MVRRLFNRPGKPQHEFPQQFAPLSSGGHYLWPLQRVQITRAEPQPWLADHYSRLFFGRGTAVQLGQPFFSWQPTRRIDEPEAIAWRADHTLLHRYRTGFQTVGQPWSTWQPYRQPSFEPEQIRQPVTDLYPYRQFPPVAVATQPFWIWQTGITRLPDAEIIRQPEHSALHLYRVGFQSVGQPWAIWAKYRQPDFEPEKIVSPQYDLYPYRQITITAGPGQPWYLWPPIQITIQPEEQMFRENHDLSLYPFRPHDAVPPLPVEAGVPAPVGHPVYIKGQRKKPRVYETANEQLKKILASITIEVVTPESKSTDVPVLVKAISGKPVRPAVSAEAPAGFMPAAGKPPAILNPDEDEEDIIAYMASRII